LDAASRRPIGPAAEAELRARLPKDGIIRALDQRGLPITRENYIGVMHGNLPPDEEWSGEHEADLPRELWQQ
jgi:hypothetical protein